MRIVIDIDGTICETKKPGQTYENVRVNPGAAEKIKRLKQAGHYIILQTARHMKTTGGDVKLVIEKVGAVTEQWLKKNGIVYDEIYFGKPYNQVLIDDRAFIFEGWEHFKPQAFNDKDLNIVIFLEPGALDKVKGKTAAERAVKCFGKLTGSANSRLIFISHKFSAAPPGLDAKLKGIFGAGVKVVSCPDSGRLEAAVAAAGLIDNFHRLVIGDSRAVAVIPKWDSWDEDNLEGMLVASKAATSKYGFVKNDQWGYVSAVSGKRSAQVLAADGLFYFNNGRDFISCARAVLKAPGSPLIFCYNELISRGQKVKAI